MTRYEVILIAQSPTRCVTANLKARDVQHLAEQLLAMYPGMEFINAKELSA